MALVDYPESFPTESVGEVVAVLRKQKPLDKASIGYHGWNVQGYLQKVVLGEPDTEAMVSEPLNITADTLADGLESLDPERPQAILGGGLTKKLLLTLIVRFVSNALTGGELPAGLEGLIDSILDRLIMVK